MKLRLLFYTFFLLSFSSYGQSLEFTDRVLDKMVLDVNLDGSGMVTKELHQELQLTQEQYEKVEMVNKKRFDQLMQAEEKFSGNPVLLRRTFNEINCSNDRVLTTVLSKEQLQKLVAKKESICLSVQQE